MGIVIVEMFTVECDNCQKNYEDISGTGFAAWTDSGVAEESADESGWVRVETETEGPNDFTRHYCPDCYFIGENDEFNLIKPK